MIRFLRRRRPPLLLRFLSTSSSSSSALVVGTLRRHGIPDDLCSTVVSRFPRILSLKPDRTLAPKLAFLRSEGFSGPELARILLRNPYVFLRSLDGFLVPRVAVLKSAYDSRDYVLDSIMRNRWVSTYGFQDNINLLRDRGVPEAVINKVFEFEVDCVSGPPREFLRTVKFIDKLNIRSTSATYSTAIRTLWRMSSSKIQGKVRLYRKLGWKEEELLGMFRMQPTIIGLSEEVVRKKVAFLRDALGWGPEFLCRYPEMMTMSVEKRIAPRCAVLDSLVSRGLLITRRGISFPVRELKLSEERFAEEFVEKHEEAAPDVARAYYAEEAEFSGWSWLKEDAQKQPPPKKLA